MGKAWPALDIHLPGGDPHLSELVLAELDDFQPTAVEEKDHAAAMRAFFSTAALRDAAAGALAASLGDRLTVDLVDVDDEDWAARSQEGLQAVTVGRIVVAPPGKRGRESFSRLDGENDSRPPFTVVIRPSTGFGTGHHATTRLMLKALQEILIADRTVLDVGCGSGVLAIAAAGLGAVTAVGIDVDPDAIANARENAELNGVADRVRFDETDLHDVSTPAGLVMANLTGALLRRSASTLAGLVESGGVLIVSGFMDSEQDMVLRELEPFFRLESIDQEDEWIGATFRKPVASR